MSSAELNQLSRINDKLDLLGDKLDQGFATVGGKLDRIDGKLDRIDGKLDRIDGKLDRLIIGQEQVISLLAEQTRLLRGLVSALTRTQTEGVSI